MSTISPTRRSDPRAATTPAAIPPYAYDDIGTPAAAHTVATHPSPPCVPRHVARNVAPHALYLPRPRHTPLCASSVIRSRGFSCCSCSSPAVRHSWVLRRSRRSPRRCCRSALPLACRVCSLHWCQVREGAAVRLAATTRASDTPILPDRTWCHGAWRIQESFACDFGTATIKVL